MCLRKTKLTAIAPTKRLSIKLWMYVLQIETPGQHYWITQTLHCLFILYNYSQQKCFKKIQYRIKTMHIFQVQQKNVSKSQNVIFSLCWLPYNTKAIVLRLMLKQILCTIVVQIWVFVYCKCQMHVPNGSSSWTGVCRTYVTKTLYANIRDMRQSTACSIFVQGKIFIEFANQNTFQYG